MSKHKKRKGQKQREEKQTNWQIIKDLFLHPFEYRQKNTNNIIGKTLGGIFLFLAVCLLFYITGHNV